MSSHEKRQNLQGLAALCEGDFDLNLKLIRERAQCGNTQELQGEGAEGVADSNSDQIGRDSIPSKLVGIEQRENTGSMDVGADLLLHDSKMSPAARQLAATYIKAGVPELFEVFGPYFEKMEGMLAEESAAMEVYYQVMQKKLDRLLKRKRGATTGQLQRLAIAMSKAIATRRAAFGLPYGALDPHKLKPANPGQQSTALELHLHNHGSSALVRRPKTVDVTPEDD
jgi:hypothetical protein